MKRKWDWKYNAWNCNWVSLAICCRRHESNFPEIFLGTLSSHGVNIRSSLQWQREMTVEMEKRTWLLADAH